MREAGPAPIRTGHWRRYRVPYLLLVLTIAPVLAAYIAYYVLPPSGRTNYGALIEPQRPAPALPLKTLDGADFDLRALHGRWVMLMVDGGECAEPCVDKLFHMRQQRTMTGKDRERIERVWLIIDPAPLPIPVMREFEGTRFVRVPAAALRDYLPLPESRGARLEDHIWIIDPAGNLMMRWPKNPDPSQTKRDLAKLLKASGNWIRIERKD